MVTPSMPSMVRAGNAAFLLDSTNSWIWNFQDWRQSLVKLQPFFLAPGQQDYRAPNAPIPTDFLGLRKAELVYTLTQPPFHYPPLDCDRILYATAWQGLTSAICYEPTIQAWRLFPRVPLGIGPTDYQIEIVYKKLPTKITAANMSSQLLPWEDCYLPVFETGLRWRAMKATPGANRNEVQALYQEFLAELNRMAANEAVNLGDETLHPDEDDVFANW